jgi:hypothetical protein
MLRIRSREGLRVLGLHTAGKWGQRRQPSGVEPRGI